LNLVFLTKIGTPFFALKIQFFGRYKENNRQIEECHSRSYSCTPWFDQTTIKKPL